MPYRDAVGRRELPQCRALARVHDDRVIDADHGYPGLRRDPRTCRTRRLSRLARSALPFAYLAVSNPITATARWTIAPRAATAAAQTAQFSALATSIAAASCLSAREALWAICRSASASSNRLRITRRVELCEV